MTHFTTRKLFKYLCSILLTSGVFIVKGGFEF